MKKVLQRCYEIFFLNFVIFYTIYGIIIFRFEDSLALRMRFLICNNNVIHLTKYCNLIAVSLHRKYVKIIISKKLNSTFK